MYSVRLGRRKSQVDKHFKLPEESMDQVRWTRPTEARLREASPTANTKCESVDFEPSEMP